MPNQALSHFLLFFVGRSVLLLFVYQKEINADGRIFCFLLSRPAIATRASLRSMHACDCANMYQSHTSASANM